MCIIRVSRQTVRLGKALGSSGLRHRPGAGDRTGDRGGVETEDREDWSDCGVTAVQAKPGGVTEQQCIVGVAVRVCRY